jgi:sugar phosphate isomerase/epimerase
MEDEIAELGRQIERMERHRDFADQMNMPTTKTLVSAPGGYNNPARDSGEYSKAFWNALRGRGVILALC